MRLLFIIIALFFQLKPVTNHKVSIADEGKVIIYSPDDLFIIKSDIKKEVIYVFENFCDHDPMCKPYRALKVYNNGMIIIKGSNHLDHINIVQHGVVHKIFLINGADLTPTYPYGIMME